jgi:hypothetical protein
VRRLGPAAIALLAASLGCGSPAELSLKLNVGAGAEAADRYRLFTRRCGEESLASRDELTPGTTVGLDPPVPADTAFYVWVQGWSVCPPGEPSVDPEIARDGDCRDEGDGRAARIVAEACSPWLRLAASETRALELELGPPSEACPPPPPGDCDAVGPLP